MVPVAGSSPRTSQNFQKLEWSDFALGVADAEAVISNATTGHRPNSVSQETTHLNVKQHTSQERCCWVAVLSVVVCWPSLAKGKPSGSFGTEKCDVRSSITSPYIPVESDRHMVCLQTVPTVDSAPPYHTAGQSLPESVFCHFQITNATQLCKEQWDHVIASLHMSAASNVSMEALPPACSLSFPARM